MKNNPVLCQISAAVILVMLCLCQGCKPNNNGNNNNNRPKMERCGAAEDFQALYARDSSVRLEYQRIENAIRDYYRLNEKESDAEGLRGGRIIIPVVAHILYNNNTADPTNVADSKVVEQIDRLNADFRRTNTDAGSVPMAFSSFAADSRIEFQLAKRDPSCGATTGITRTLVTKTQFIAIEAKSTSTGGVNPWDTKKYLNVWVVPKLCKSATSCNLLGSSSFPSYPANEQGFVVAYKFLGNTTDPNYNLGRTAVHEFGHFFNLKHIWGDDCGNGNGTCSSPAECAGTDDVTDTPNQGEMNFNNPTFPLTDCCSSTSPGVMFMDYMDYTDDDGMFMFSQGQVDRMVATLYTTQADLLASDALIPPPAVATSDLFIQDTPEDIGNEPNNESTDFYISEDIWVRNTNDGLTNKEHQNPVGGAQNYVYVRVRNRGCATATSATVKLYWAKASTGLSWPDPWNGGVSVGTAVMGGALGNKASGSIAGGSSTILEFSWPSTPNPTDYASFGADQAHFCLLARIETPTQPETADLWNNVKNNNNIAWKNLEVAAPGGDREASTIMANYDRENNSFSLTFEAPKGEESVFSFGAVYVELSGRTYKDWVRMGSKGTNIAIEQNNLIRLTESGATIENIPLKYRDFAPMKVSFREDEKKRLGPHVYFMDIKQYKKVVSPKTIVGGQRIIVKSFNKNR